MVSLRSWIMVEFYYTSTLCERRWTFKCSVESWLYGRLLCLLLKLHVFPRAALFKADPLQCKSPCYKRVTSGEKRTIVFFRYTNDYITLIILTGTCSRGTPRKKLAKTYSMSAYHSVSLPSQWRSSSSISAQGKSPSQS
jgi:hypothetical protein